jgi:hypothetical protein
LFALAAPAAAESGSELYASLRQAAPDGRRVVLQDVQIVRDVFTIHFQSGTLHLLAPVAGRTLGAVFLGSGEYRLTPATAGERYALAFRSRRPDLETLSDRFDGLVLLFTDGTGEELLQNRTAETGPPEPEAQRAFDRFVEWQRKELRHNLQLRLAEDLLNDDGLADGFFLAALRGAERGRSAIVLDPRGVIDDEESCLMVFGKQGAEIWYSSHAKSEVDTGAAAGCRTKLSADAEHYDLVTSVVSGTELEGTATIRVASTIPRLALLRFGLLPRLRLAEVVRLDAGVTEPVALAFVQEDQDGDADPAVLLDRPLERGERVELRLRYAGKGVLLADGDGVYRVEARSEWYPHFGDFQDRATYRLTYRAPKDRTLVSVGHLTGRENDGALTISHFEVDSPITVAGFNYGKFTATDRVEDKSGVKISVFTNPGTPDVINEINGYLRAQNETGFRESMDIALEEGSYAGTAPSGVSHVNVSTDLLAEEAMADAVNSMRVYSQLFGKLPLTELSISQQSQWFFGQAWPSLIFVPYIAALDGTARMELGLSDTDTASFIDQVTIHEMAHQWWGHSVGVESYRDEWLSEGFAEFSAGLVLELTRGAAAADRFWQRRRYYLLRDPSGSDVAATYSGPITQGFRLVTERSTDAYDTLVYGKGAFVLHMLRMLMREAQAPNPDEKFFAMLRDFAATHAGRSASTDDFKKIVEKHMTPNLNATRDGKIDWFFDQWVDGTDVPTYRVAVAVEKADKGQYHLVGTVSQEGVPDTFMALVPLYADLGEGRYQQFGRAPFKGNQTHSLDVTLELPSKPKGVVANAHYEVLAWDPSKKKAR